MAGLGAFDALAEGIANAFVPAFGGTCDIEIHTSFTTDHLNGTAVNNVVTFEQVSMTPPNPYSVRMKSQDSVKSGEVSTIVTASEVTTKPEPDRSFLTIYSNGVAQEKMKIVDVMPIMSGNNTVAYELVLGGAH